MALTPNRMAISLFASRNGAMAEQREFHFGNAFSLRFLFSKLIERTGSSTMDHLVGFLLHSRRLRMVADEE
jgi:hypothetical protein